MLIVLTEVSVFLVDTWWIRSNTSISKIAREQKLRRSDNSTQTRLYSHLVKPEFSWKVDSGLIVWYE